MPELPDIEAIRARVASRATGRRIGDVDVVDDAVLRQISARTLRETVVGQDFSDITRHGKVLFAHVAGGPWLAMHFGMTGDLALVAGGDALPDHARVVFTFDDDERLAFDNQRKFGWIEPTEDVDTYLQENEIGPDALTLDRDDFRQIVGGSRGQVKSALMNQSKLAGIGNVYSDEILFRARIRPDVKAPELGEAQLESLHDAMGDVLEMAIKKLRAGEALPRNWLARHREEGETCPRCGEDLSHDKIGGRTAWFCANCQGGADG